MIVKIIQTYSCCGSEWTETITPKNEGIYHNPDPYCVRCLKPMPLIKVEAIEGNKKKPFFNKETIY